MSLRQILDDYRTWLMSIDAAFDRVRSANPGVVPCRGGCSQCCYALFAVPVIDGFLILEGLRRQGDEVLRQTLARCEALFRDFQREICAEAAIPFRIEPVGWKDFEKFAEQFQRPCPFLTDAGWCGVYEWRPKICRLAGTVFADPVSGTLLPDFCPTAADARERTGFRSAPMDLIALDLTMMEFRDLFREQTGGRIPSGHTFPAAGALEGAFISF